MANKAQGKYPFIMQKDGLGALFGPGMAEGPFPEHYEPLESPLENNPMSSQRINPAAEIFSGEMDKVASASSDFPYVCTTYSCTEHWCSGALTRWQAWLLEAMPELYVEIGEQLAKEKGIKNGQRVKVVSARGEAPCVAMVTKHQKSRAQGQPGGIIRKEAAIDASNVMLVCQKCGKPSRAGKKVQPDGTKISVCKKCGQQID